MSNRHDYYSIVKWEFHLSSSGIGFGLGFLVGLHLTKFSIKDFVNLILFKIVEIPNVVININKQWLLRIITRILSKSYSSITKYTDTLLRGGELRNAQKVVLDELDVWKKQKIMILGIWFSIQFSALYYKKVELGPFPLNSYRFLVQFLLFET